jgi:hypothetical protein
MRLINEMTEILTKPRHLNATRNHATELRVLYVADTLGDLLRYLWDYFAAQTLSFFLLYFFIKFYLPFMHDDCE